MWFALEWLLLIMNSLSSTSLRLHSSYCPDHFLPTRGKAETSGDCVLVIYGVPFVPKLVQTVVFNIAVHILNTAGDI